MAYLLIGLIVAIFVILCAVFVIGACMRSAQCSQDEAAEARELTNAELERKLKKISANEKWQARWKDGQPPGIGKEW